MKKYEITSSRFLSLRGPGLPSGVESSASCKPQCPSESFSGVLQLYIYPSYSHFHILSK